MLESSSTAPRDSCGWLAQKQKAYSVGHWREDPTHKPPYFQETCYLLGVCHPEPPRAEMLQVRDTAGRHLSHLLLAQGCLWASCASCSDSDEVLRGLRWMWQSSAGTDGLQEFCLILFPFPCIVLTAEDLTAFLKMSSFPNSSLKIPGQVKSLDIKSPV